MASTTDTVGIRLSLRGQQQVRQGFRDTSQGVKGLREEMKRATITSEELGSGLRKAASVSLRAATTVALAGAGIVGTLATIGVKTAATNEQAEIAFTNMLGSAGSAKAYLGELKAFAAATPFELPDVQMGAQRLMAMGVNARNVLPYLTAIGDAVSGMGGGAEQINQVVTAIGQIQAKGKVQGDEILQLTEAGIPALRILAAQYGVTTAEMSKMMEKGKVSSEDALPKLIEGIEKGTKATKGFGGMMEQQSRTLAGRWSTIKDVTTQGLAGAVEPLLPTLSRAMDWLAVKLPSGMRALERGSDSVASTLNLLRPVFRVLQEDAVVVANAFTEGFRKSGYSLDDVRTGAGNLKEAFDPNGPLVSGVASLAGNLGTVAGYMAKIGTRADQLNGLITRVSGYTSGGENDLTNLGVKQLTGGKVDLYKSGWLTGKTPTSAKGSLFGGWGDSFKGVNYGGARAQGGNVSAGKVYRINERGMEYFQPNSGGRIIPTRPNVAGMLSGEDVTVHVVTELDGEVVATRTVHAVRRQAARRG